ncbi:unnamed protein product [Effrenium voratum]|nr:unnamed protein product [Effrenium voratum]CAJ1437967.1 unnamed protein product [Effrenium voratum]
MAVCPPTPRLAPCQPPFEVIDELELPPPIDEEASAVCTFKPQAPKTPRLSPSPMPFDISMLPELYLPDACDAEADWTLPSYGPMKSGPSGELLGMTRSRGGSGDSGMLLPSSVCSTRCSSPGGLSGADSPWLPACMEKRDSRPVAFELLVSGGA